MSTTQMSVYIKSGSRDEAPHEYGITHFTEHAICMGTPSHPSFRQIWDYININGGLINAETNKTYMSVWGRILAENIDILATTIADQLKNSLFDTQTLIKERGTVLDEYRRNTDKFYQFVHEKLFAGSGYAHNIVGTPETIQSFTANQAREYLNKILSAQNTIICITGKIINESELLKTLEKLFSWVPSFAVSRTPTKLQTDIIAHDEKREQKNIKICLAFPAPIPSSLEYNRNRIAQGKFRANLAQQLRDTIRGNKGLIYGISTGHIGDEYACANTISTETSPENIAQVVAIIAQTCRHTSITDADIQRIKMKTKFNCANWSESIPERQKTFLEFMHKFGTLYNFDDFIHTNETITADEVINATKDFFTSPVSIVTQGPIPDTDLKNIWYENFNHS